MIWHNVTWHDMTWHDMTWHDMRRDVVRWHDVTWYDLTWDEMTWHETRRHDMTSDGMTWHDMTWDDAINIDTKVISWSPSYNQWKWYDQKVIITSTPIPKIQGDIFIIRRQDTKKRSRLHHVLCELESIYNITTLHICSLTMDENLSRPMNNRASA